MKIKAVIFNEILYGPLSPWLSSNANETKFKELLNNQLRANKDNHFQYFKYLIDNFKYYSINLNITHISENIHSANIAKFAELQNNFSLFTIPVFYSKTSEFYYYLINNEYNRIRNAITYNVKNSTDEIDSVFHVVNLLDNLEYLFEQFNEKKYDDKISLYVLNAMKLTLFRLYEEIKIVFPSYIGSEALTENEIINFIAPDFEANKNNPDTIDYTISQYLSAKKPEDQKDIVTEKKELKPDKPIFILNKSDFRSGFKGKLSFDDIRNIQLFSEMEKNLYDHDFIDLNYNFTNKHNKKKEFAAIIKILISKKYFRESNFKHHHKFKDFEYRQYLDHRYNVDTSQQFRKCNPEEIDSITKANFWIDNLPVCR
jgi:hypothetical protein